MSFGIYIIGFLVLIGGLIYAGVLLHIATHWIAVGAIVLFGLALLKGVQATLGKYPRNRCSRPHRQLQAGRKTTPRHGVTTFTKRRPDKKPPSSKLREHKRGVRT